MDPLVATFPAGVTTSGDLGCVNITILDDMVLEGQHSFVVQIADVTPDEVNIISPSIANVFIGDNEGEFIVIHYTDCMIGEVMVLLHRYRLTFVCLPLCKFVSHI